jgi:hypothetical protein
VTFLDFFFIFSFLFQTRGAPRELNEDPDEEQNGDGGAEKLPEILN